MNIIDRIKKFFKKGGYTLTGQTLKSVNDHPKINIDPEELARIERNFREYKGDYPKVEYINSMGQLKERDYMYLNMLKTSSDLLAGLVFNEECEIEIEDKTANEFIQHVFEHNDFKKNLSQYLEPMFATGGLAVRPYVDVETGEVEFSWALANAFYPLKSNSNGISEGVIKSVTTKFERDKIYYYTLLEFHEWQDQLYVITNELYKSDNKNEIGKQIQLDEIYEGLPERVELPDFSRPIFNYVKPAGFNNINPHSPLGLGITDNCKPTLKQINDTYDQFNWEIAMGQRTVFLSDHMLQTLPSEDGLPPEQVFDPNVNVFKKMRMSADEEFVKDVTSDIRSQQYIDTINHHMKTLEMDLKLSVGTFSFDGKSVKTATEVVSENSLTYRTRNDHVSVVEKFIKGLIVSTLELAKSYDLYKGDIPTFEQIGVDFDDGVFQDRTALLKFYGAAKSFGFIPTTEAIMRIFKIPKETAEAWVKEILADQVAADPMLLDDERERRRYGDEE